MSPPTTRYEDAAEPMFGAVEAHETNSTTATAANTMASAAITTANNGANFFIASSSYLRSLFGNNEQRYNTFTFDITYFNYKNKEL